MQPETFAIGRHPHDHRTSSEVPPFLRTPSVCGRPPQVKVTGSRTSVASLIRTTARYRPGGSFVASVDSRNLAANHRCVSPGRNDVVPPEHEVLEVPVSGTSGCATGTSPNRRSAKGHPLNEITRCVSLRMTKCPSMPAPPTSTVGLSSCRPTDSPWNFGDACEGVVVGEDVGFADPPQPVETRTAATSTTAPRHTRTHA
jgi:hypothetical protein